MPVVHQQPFFHTCKEDEFGLLKIAIKSPMLRGGLHSTMNSILPSHPAAPGSILGIPKVLYTLDVAEI